MCYHGSASSSDTCQIEESYINEYIIYLGLFVEQSHLI